MVFLYKSTEISEKIKKAITYVNAAKCIVKWDEKLRNVIIQISSSKFLAIQSTVKQIVISNSKYFLEIQKCYKNWAIIPDVL